MASLYIRNLSDSLVRAIRIKALQEDIRIDELLRPFLELAVKLKAGEAMNRITLVLGICALYIAYMTIGPAQMYLDALVSKWGR